MKGRSTVNCQILLTRPTKIFSVFFRRGEWSYRGEAVVSNPGRLLGAESKLQLNLLMLTLMSWKTSLEHQSRKLTHLWVPQSRFAPSPHTQYAHM